MRAGVAGRDAEKLLVALARWNGDERWNGGTVERWNGGTDLGLTSRLPGCEANGGIEPADTRFLGPYASHQGGALRSSRNDRLLRCTRSIVPPFHRSTEYHRSTFGRPGRPLAPPFNTVVQ